MQKNNTSLQWLSITECKFCMSPLSNTPDLYHQPVSWGSDSWNKCVRLRKAFKMCHGLDLLLYIINLDWGWHCFFISASYCWHGTRGTKPQLKYVSKTRNGKGSLTWLMKFLCPLRQQTLQTPSDTPVWQWTRVSLNQLFHIIRRSLPNRLPIESHFE